MITEIFVVRRKYLVVFFNCFNCVFYWRYIYYIAINRVCRNKFSGSEILE